MVRRRAKAAGIATEVCNHTVRGTGWYTEHLGVRSRLCRGATLKEKSVNTPSLTARSLRFSAQVLLEGGAVFADPLALEGG
jgi:hypothetical protein